MSTTPLAHPRRRSHALPAALLLACILTTQLALAGVREVRAIALNVADLERQVQFFTTVLAFERDGDIRHASDPATAGLYALPGAHTRSATLRLGDEFVALTQFDAPASGRPMPADTRSTDHWFQHIAIVVRDMDAAYARLQRARVRHISPAPQTLPSWNLQAGGIRAFYFQDPEQHVLELIWFPPGKGDPRWQRPTDRLFLGIDHTAIVVSDTDRSLRFYRDALGFRVVGEADNHGVEQEHLNQVFGARLRITGLRAPGGGPGVEFLEYIAPPGGRPLPRDAQVHDRLAWRTQLTTENPPATTSAAGKAGGRAVSPRLLRDPDGHLLEFTP